jgi:uncharacterized protein (TIGR02594 family)
MIDVKKVQRRLKELGFDPGKIDGVAGRRTKAAVEAFQKKNDIKVKFPGTIGPKTLAALFPTQTGEEKPQVSTLVERPWLDLAIRKKGLHEGRDFADLSRFLKSDGRTLGDPRTNPWCGDFVETCIAVALPGETIVTNPYLAQNWRRFGVKTKPTLGAVLVFWRGSRTSTKGHVGFAVGESSSRFYVLGGNQSNSINVAPISKSRLLAARWPATVANPETKLPTFTGGQLSINEQ